MLGGKLKERKRICCHPVVWIMDLQRAGGRRQADVLIPRSSTLDERALDFACTSDLRADFLQMSAEDGSSIFPYYEDLKRSYKNTDDECKSRGLKFFLWYWRPTVADGVLHLKSW